MEDVDMLDEGAQDILRELGNIGTGNAVIALSQMMEGDFEIGFPRLQIMKYQDIYLILQEAEELLTGIMVEVSGEVQGIFLFLLDEAFTRKLLEKFLGQKERDLNHLDEMEKSMILELGNIMCGSYIRALCQMVNMRIDVSTPDMCIDMGGAIIGVLLPRFLKLSDNVLLIENEFRMDQESYLGRILFLPEFEALEAIFQKLRE